MKVLLDRAQCEANGLCVDAAPEVFELDDEDVLHVLIEAPGEAQRAAVERAVARCPKMALTLIED